MAVSYATRADIALHGASADALAAIPTGEQDAALAWASRRIDGAVGQRYAVPLTGWSDDVRGACCALAAYRLLARGSFDSPDEGGSYRKGYDDALAWLQEVRAGDTDLAGVALPGVSGDPVAPTALSDPPRGWDD